MTEAKTEAFATRVSSERAGRIRAVVEHTECSQSDLLARALEFYIRENPDRVPPFDRRETHAGPLEEAGILGSPAWEEWSGFED